MGSHRLPIMLLAVAALLGGCYESTKPLAPAGTVLADESVSGKWNCVPDPPLRPQDKATMSVRAVDQHTYDITWQDGDKTSRFRAHGSKVGKATVLNVLEVAPSAKWFFLRYKRDGSKLALSVISDQNVKGGYEARKLDDIRTRGEGDELYVPFAACTRAK